jgi:hypothetical protein
MIQEEGILEWNASTTYYTNGFCQVSGVIYKSLVDDNINNAPASSPTKWAICTFITIDAQTFTGVKTFSSSPIVPTPTTALQAANKSYVDSANKVKGYANVTYSGGTPTLRKSSNVASISDDGAGILTINWTTAFDSAYYAVIPSINHLPGAGTVSVMVSSKTASSCTIRVYAEGSGYVDPSIGIDVVAFGDLVS